MSFKLSPKAQEIFRIHKLGLFIVGAPGIIMHVYIDGDGIAKHGFIRTNNCKAAVFRNGVFTTIEADKICRYKVEEKRGGAKLILVKSVAIEDFLAHDVIINNQNLLIANTQYSCLSKINLRVGTVAHIFKPFFIDKLAAEDRTHLNGFAWRDFTPVYVSALGQTNKHRTWKENIQTRGIIIDVKTNKLILTGLNMPHSPRIYRGNLYFVTSGDGRLVRYNAKQKTTETIITLPYFVRGLVFYRDYAFIGISTERHDDKSPNQSNKFAGVAVVDIKRRQVIEIINLPEEFKEVYNVYTNKP
jgi:uncharacterized protein (TIGR03032 family)